MKIKVNDGKQKTITQKDIEVRLEYKGTRFPAGAELVIDGVCTSVLAEDKEEAEYWKTVGEDLGQAVANILAEKQVIQPTFGEYALDVTFKITQAHVISPALG